MHAALLCLALAAEAYIHSDVVRLREAPSSKAAIIAKLRINTRVDVIDQDGEWVNLRLEHAAVTAFEAPLAVAGWTLSSLVGPQRLTAAALDDQLAGLEGAARLPVLERLAALEPREPRRINELAEAYRVAGQSAQAAAMLQRLHGQGPIYVGICSLWGHPNDSEQAMLLAVYERGTWRSLVHTSVRGDAALQRLGLDLAGWPWVGSYGEDADRGIVGSPFASPRLRADGDAPDSELASRALGLGRCRAAEITGEFISSPAALAVPDADARGKVDRLVAVKQKRGRDAHISRWFRAGIEPGLLVGLGRYTDSPVEDGKQFERGFWLIALPADAAPVELHIPVGGGC